MSDVNWWLMALAFVLGLLLMFASMIRRVKREVRVDEALGRGPGIDAWADLKVPGVDVKKPDVDVKGVGVTAGAAAGGAAAAKFARGESGPESATAKIAAVGAEPYGPGLAREAGGGRWASGWTIQTREWLPAAAIVAAIVVAVPAALLVGSKGGQVLFLVVGVVLALGLCALSSPIAASIVLLLTLFLRLPLREYSSVATRPFLIALILVIIATALWMDRNPTRLRGTGAVAWPMGLYLLWNVHSMFAPHKYPAGDQLGGIAISVPAFIVSGTLIPFVMYMVGRYTFDRTAAVRGLLWTILAFVAYSAAMSILQFTGPTEWVWPRYIVDAPNWDGRAVGVFNQPVVNGLVLALGFAIAMLLISRRSEPAWRKWLAFGVAIACGYGIYLTHTRAVWLSAAIVLIIGAVLARGYRTGFIATLAAVMVIIAFNWSVFVGTDRQAGGVGSPDSVEDRLNYIQTSLWAAAQKPLEGWGIGRFYAINTYHHQQWSPDVPWINGYGYSSHLNELGILAELGVIGLALWVCVLALIAYRLWDAYRTLPDDDLCGKPLAITAIMAIAVLVCTGFTVDLRFFDFPTAAVFLLAGITIGWSDRHKRAQAAADDDVAEQVRPQYA